MVDAYVNGDRVRRTAATKRDALALLEQLHRDQILQRPYMALADVVLRYEQSARAHGRRAGSIKQALHHLGKVVDVLGPTFDVQDLDQAALERVIEARRREGNSPATINGTLKYLKAALRAAEVRPAAKFQKLKTVKRDPQVLTPEEVERLLGVADEYHRVVLLIAVRAGLRHQEILHLTRADVDFGAGVLRVTAKCGWAPKDWEERAIPMGKRLAAALERHLEAMNDKSPGAWLFPGYEDGPVVNVDRGIRACYRAAGLYDPARKPGLHMLRKTCATEMLGRGVDIETVRKIFGWADLNTPMAYLTTTDERLRAAVEDD